LGDFLFKNKYFVFSLKKRQRRKMTIDLVFVGALNTPNYIFGGITGVGPTGCAGITGASRVGNTIFSVPDTGWYIVNSDLSISPWALPVEIAIDPGDITIGAVSIDQPVADAVEIAPYFDTKRVAVRGTSEKLSATDVYVMSLIVFPFTANVGNIYLGTAGVQWDDPLNKQIVLTPTSPYVGFEAPVGYKLNLKNFYIDKDNNDGGNTDGVYFMFLK
jgi:hypothetical protein